MQRINVIRSYQFTLTVKKPQVTMYLLLSSTCHIKIIKSIERYI